MMSKVVQPYAAQVANIQQKTGKTLEELTQIVQASGEAKHGALRKMLMETLGLGHGDANTLVHVILKTDGERAALDKSMETVLDEIYSGSKVALRPIHEALMSQIEGFGPFEVAPKKGYVSLRRKKQFAMLGPGTKGRLDVGLNIKNLIGTDRLIDMGAGKMCNYTVKLTHIEEVDAELCGWLLQAYGAAG